MMTTRAEMAATQALARGLRLYPGGFVKVGDCEVVVDDSDKIEVIFENGEGLVCDVDVDEAGTLIVVMLV